MFYERLAAKCPKLLPTPPMCGFACPKGWETIVEELFDKLETISPDTGVVCQQVKEKFGGLRVYLSAGNEEIFGLIDAATAESHRTCETCGKPGTRINKTGWVRTLCKTCR